MLPGGSPATSGRRIYRGGRRYDEDDGRMEQEGTEEVEDTEGKGKALGSKDLPENLVFLASF